MNVKKRTGKTHKLCTLYTAVLLALYNKCSEFPSMMSMSLPSSYSTSAAWPSRIQTLTVTLEHHISCHGNMPPQQHTMATTTPSKWVRGPAPCNVFHPLTTDPSTRTRLVAAVTERLLWWLTTFPLVGSIHAVGMTITLASRVYALPTAAAELPVKALHAVYVRGTKNKTPGVARS